MALYSILRKYINIQFNFDVDSNEKFISELIQQWSKSKEIKKSKVRFDNEARTLYKV